MVCIYFHPELCIELNFRKDWMWYGNNFYGYILLINEIKNTNTNLKVEHSYQSQYNTA
jgi:hypothetical protein